jgi:hypothetical protein
MQQRNLLKMFLLTLVTLGIYQIYWLYATRKEMIARGGLSIPRVIVLFLPLLLLVAGFILLAITSSLTGNSSSGVTPANVIVLIVCIISMIAWPIISIWWTWRYAVAVEATTEHRMSRDLVFWTWLLLVFISSPVVWMLMVQNEFNHLAPKKHAVQPKA